VPSVALSNPLAVARAGVVRGQNQAGNLIEAGPARCKSIANQVRSLADRGNPLLGSRRFGPPAAGAQAKWTIAAIAVATRGVLLDNCLRRCNNGGKWSLTL